MEVVLLWILLPFAVLYLLLVRPQRRRLAEHQRLQSSLVPGDEVITAGGIFGRIAALDDDSVSLEVAPGTVIRLARGAVNRRVVPAPGDGSDEGAGAR